MRVNELVEGYKKVGDKDGYLKRHIKVKEYVPFIEKATQAEALAKITTLKDGRVNVNTPARFYLTYLRMIAMWTDVQIDFSDGVAQFDLLDENGLVDKIVLEMIPERERDMFSSLIDMSSNDLMTNRYDVHAYVDEILELIKVVSKDAEVSTK